MPDPKAETPSPEEQEEIRALYASVGIYRQIYEDRNAGKDCAALYAQLIALEEEALAKFPESADLNSNHGWALNECDRLDEALPYVQTAARLAPDDAHTLASLAHVLNRLSRHEEARDTLAKAVALAPEGAYYAAYGYSLLMCGETDNAAAALKTSLALTPEKTSLNNLRYINGAAPQDIQPEDPYFLVHAGARASGQKLTQADYREILPYVAAECARAPQNTDFVTTQGAVLNKLEEYAQALAVLQKAQALLPEPDQMLAVETGYALNGVGRHAEALPLLQTAADNGAIYPDVYNAIGDAAYHLGQYDRALFGFKAATDIAPRFAAGHYNIGKTLVQLGKRDEAKNACETARRLAAETGDGKTEASARALLKELSPDTGRKNTPAHP